MKVVCGCCEPPVPADAARRGEPARRCPRSRTASAPTRASASRCCTRIASAPELAGADHAHATTTTRITLLDLWAAVADVLTFYQERYANEAFLRTAQFRDSILRLAGLIGYRLRPGTAAQTSVAFTLDRDNPLTILAGQKVQSVPEAGAAADVSKPWNRWRPMAFQPAADLPGARQPAPPGVR